MVLAPAPPRSGPARPLPEPDLVPVLPAPGPAVPDPEPRPPAATAEPDDILTLCTLPERRRRRRRRLAVAAAVLAAATAWVGLGGWQARAPTPGRAYAPNSRAVIQLARARQHRRHQRIAQAGADTIAAGGGGAAAPPHSPWPTGTRQHRPGHHEFPRPGPAGLNGINVLGWGCTPLGSQAIAAAGRHVWVVCAEGTVLEFDAVTGTFVANLASPGLGNLRHPPAAVASDGRHVWVTNPVGGWVTELDAASGALVRERVSLRVQPASGRRLGRSPRVGGQLHWQLGN